MKLPRVGRMAVLEKIDENRTKLGDLTNQEDEMFEANREWEKL